MLGEDVSRGHCCRVCVDPDLILHLLLLQRPPNDRTHKAGTDLKQHIFYLIHSFHASKIQHELINFPQGLLNQSVRASCVPRQYLCCHHYLNFPSMSLWISRCDSPSTASLVTGPFSPQGEQRCSCRVPTLPVALHEDCSSDTGSQAVCEAGSHQNSSIYFKSSFGNVCGFCFLKHKQTTPHLHCKHAENEILLK